MLCLIYWYICSPILYCVLYTIWCVLSRRTTDHALLKIQQRKDLYEDVYQQVLEDCRGSATGATDELDEKLEALQREAQTVSQGVE